MDLYDKKYYDEYGGIGYTNKIFQDFHHNVAICIKHFFNPQTILDVGCANGQLSSYLMKYGIRAYGVDGSKHAISSQKGLIKNFIAVSSLPELKLPEFMPEKFDIITCIEVLEHIKEENAEQSIKRLTELSDKILFSSTPDDFDDPTHFNVRPESYWVSLFQKYGFFKNEDFNADFIAKHAMLLERKI